MSIAAHQERLMTIVQGPHLSEKSHIVGEKNQVVFKVRTDATKPEIKKAVELLFEVTVEGVTVINYQGKTQRLGTTKGGRANWKKAYFTLAEGSQLDFLGAD